VVSLRGALRHRLTPEIDRDKCNRSVGTLRRHEHVAGLIEGGTEDRKRERVFWASSGGRAEADFREQLVMGSGLAGASASGSETGDGLASAIVSGSEAVRMAP